MISLVIDTNIFFSAMYNKNGNERKILDFSIFSDELQLFSPDIFWMEIKRNLMKKLGYSESKMDEIISKFDIIDVPQEKYGKFTKKAKSMISHENDIAFVSTALFLNCPIWSGNTVHFKQLRNSNEIIWFKTTELVNYLKEKGIFESFELF
ncbi:MAG: PIN domain-containing protein [Promethearchaeia archaeon]